MWLVIRSQEPRDSSDCYSLHSHASSSRHKQLQPDSPEKVVVDILAHEYEAAISSLSGIDKGYKNMKRKLDILRHPFVTDSMDTKV